MAPIDIDKEARDRLSKYIKEGIKSLSSAAEAFNNIVIDLEQHEYSKTKGAALVVMLDSMIKLAGHENHNVLVMAAGILMQMSEDDEMAKLLKDEQNKEEEVIKEGKNLIKNIPKTIH